MRRWILIAALALCSPGVLAQSAAPVASAEDSPQTLEALLARFAKIQGLLARYVEEKRIALLKMPLRSEGTVAFAAPGSLVRRVEKPEPASLLLDGEVLWVADASGKRKIELAESAIVKHFVLTFVNVLRGDRAALERAYVLAFTAGPAGWKLELTPKAPELRKLIAGAELEGHGGEVERMTLREENGDVTVMQFSAVDSSVRFDAAERARTFQLDAPRPPGR